MTRPPRRLVLITAAIVVVAGVAVGALASVSKSSVTRARLERSLPQTFANLYVQQAKLLGHKGVTVQSLHARAQGDKGGPNVADVGPGADWICLMKWHDPNIDQTLLPGKFEMNVHSNDCYTAGGPSKIVGLLTITDKHGNDVPNPVFEFDGCFDPHASDRPTGVTIEPNTTSSTPPPPSLFRTAASCSTMRAVSRPCSPARRATAAAPEASARRSTAARSARVPSRSHPARRHDSPSCSAGPSAARAAPLP